MLVSREVGGRTFSISIFNTENKGFFFQEDVAFRCLGSICTEVNFIAEDDMARDLVRNKEETKI